MTKIDSLIEVYTQKISTNTIKIGLSSPKSVLLTFILGDCAKFS